MKILVTDIVGQNAISMQSGKNLYEKISKPLLSTESVELDFGGVKLFASPFFNASIGLLLKDIQVSDLQKHLSFINLSEVGRQLLNHVIANAIKYYAMEGTSIAAMKKIIKDRDE